jgi:hypothetical protein
MFIRDFPASHYPGSMGYFREKRKETAARDEMP